MHSAVVSFNKIIHRLSQSLSLPKKRDDVFAFFDIDIGDMPDNDCRPSAVRGHTVLRYDWCHGHRIVDAYLQRQARLLFQHKRVVTLRLF